MTTLPILGGINGKRVEYTLSQDDSMHVTAIPIEEDGGFGTAIPLGMCDDIKGLDVQQQIMTKLGLLG